MKKMLHFLFVLICMLNSQDVIRARTQQTFTTSAVIVTELQLLDSTRNREIPCIDLIKS